MFSELMHSIWDEFSKLVFHAEIEVQAGNGAATTTAPTRRPALDYSGGTAAAHPSALGTGRGRRRGGATALGRLRQPPNLPSAATWLRRTVVKDEHDEVRPQRPLLVREWQEVQEVPRRVRALQTGASRRPRSLVCGAHGAPCVLDLLGFRALTWSIQ